MTKSKYLSGSTYLSSKTQKKMRNLVEYQRINFLNSTKRNHVCPRCNNQIDILDEIDADHADISFRHIAGMFMDSYINILGGSEKEFYESMKYVLDEFLHDYRIKSFEQIERLDLYSRGNPMIEDVFSWLKFHEMANTYKAMHRGCHRAKSKEEQ